MAWKVEKVGSAAGVRARGILLEARAREQETAGVAGTALPRPSAIGDFDSDFRAPGLTIRSIPRKQNPFLAQRDPVLVMKK